MKKVLFRKKTYDEYPPFFNFWNKELEVYCNLKLIILELLFSRMLVEMLIDTASKPLERPEMERGSTAMANARSWKSDNGMVDNIEHFIPATFMTKIVEKQLVEVLFFKFHMKYQFLVLTQRPEHQIQIDDHSYNLTSTLFRVNKNKLKEIPTYIAKIDAIWISFEMTVAVLAYFLSNSIEAALATTAILELIKRVRF